MLGWGSYKFIDYSNDILIARLNAILAIPIRTESEYIRISHQTYSVLSRTRVMMVDWIRTEADCIAETQAVVFVSGIPTTSTTVHRDNPMDYIIIHAGDPLASIPCCLVNYIVSEHLATGLNMYQTQRP
ncbi:hypothetical protein An02g12580 [Aspergillus niger]|uniref:Uncharacterized protein n=2 Tax=Aspergillus niger TaxID=5061 RepID=A2QEX8_ASPNC|nr:hypothetical protein An02g12580 [Aspergillus niger]CAK44528.1 hypothetical protein An02g12580 [Aspergillus niger]